MTKISEDSPHLVSFSGKKKREQLQLVMFRMSGDFHCLVTNCLHVTSEMAWEKGVCSY